MKHIAIIMDGNRRFAKNHGKSAKFGHEKGMEKVKEVCKFAKEAGVSFLTLFAFSSENWNRANEEIQNLNMLLEEFLNTETENFIQNKTKVRVIGEREPYSESIKKKLAFLEKETSEFTEFCLIIALNYGGRNEILNATNLALQEGKKVVTKEEFEEKLYTHGVPEPDLLIRTGGAFRLSNFLLWQMAYTELYFTKTLWPEFSREEFFKAVEFFNSQQRNFGS